MSFDKRSFIDVNAALCIDLLIVSGGGSMRKYW